MIALDTDVLTEILLDDPACVARLSLVSEAERCLPIVVATELLRGRLHTIRQAEAGKGRIGLDRAFELFRLTLEGIQDFRLLPYTDRADSQFQTWRRQKIRIGTNDLRIAAICVVHAAMLATRNERDYIRVPGLSVEIW